MAKRPRSRSPENTTSPAETAASKVRRSDRERRPSTRVLEGGGLPIPGANSHRQPKNRESSPATSDDDTVSIRGMKDKATCDTEEEEDAVHSGAEVIDIQSDDDQTSSTDATGSDKSRSSSPALSVASDSSEDQLGMLKSMCWICT